MQRRRVITGVLSGVCTAGACLGASAAEPVRALAPTPGPDRQPAVAFPHPLIIEILFAVPPGLEGDASKDGARSATGDEFVALVNPHDKPIQLAGYTLSDANTRRKGQWGFTCPPLELKPGQVVVVFNGFETSIKGPYGTEAAPAGPNPDFHNARVFSMALKNGYAALGNTADCVTLAAPDERLVQRVRWGELKGDSEPKGQAALEDEAPVSSRGSVVREGAGKAARFRPHADLDKRDFDPGRWPIATPTSADGPGAPPSDDPPPPGVDPAPAIPSIPAPLSPDPTSTPPKPKKLRPGVKPAPKPE